MFTGSSYWGEIAVLPIDGSYQESVTAVTFDGLHELIWAGSSAGRLFTYDCPGLSLYSYWPAHTNPVVSLAPLPSSDLCLSVSAESALLSNSGGIRRTGYHSQACVLSCGCLEPGPASRSAYLGQSTGGVLQLDLATGRTTTMSQCVVTGEGVAGLKPGLGRGLVAVATTSGKLLLVDPRTGFKGDGVAVVTAHSAGVAAIEVRDGLAATCGYGLRGGIPVPEPYLKVFDVRGSLLRPMLSIPFSGPGGSPTCLSFHPQLPSVLLTGCSRGGLSLVDTGVGAAVATFQVDTGGGALSACALGSVGEMWGLGDVMGCVRLWSETQTARVHAQPSHVQLPPTPPQVPAVSLKETDILSRAKPIPLDMAAGNRLLSDVDQYSSMSVGLAPRLIDVKLLANSKQVDFVGHLANPHYTRGEAYGVATFKVAALRNTRIDMKPLTRSKGDAARGERIKRRSSAGGSMPRRFHHVEIRAQTGLKFEEFQFSAYNSTRFAGLENDIPNAYANALLQVLYFTPDLRAALLADHLPEPDEEFCLACELALLFRMMTAAHGSPCQATNLLRALRQLREAAALGLLDANINGGGSVTLGAAEAAHEMTGLKEWALGRRCVALARFLLDTLSKEGGTKQPHHPGQPTTPRSGIAQPAARNTGLAGVLDRLYALPMRQRLQVLSGPTEADGNRPHRLREMRIMQVDLVYPKAASKATRDARAAALKMAHKPLRVAGGITSPDPSTPPASLPPPGLTPSLLGTGGSTPASPTTSSMLGPGQGAGSGGEAVQQPSFAELLQASLVAINETRAWFDDARGYAMIRQMRTPLGLPQVLAVGCAVSDASDLEWWLPDMKPVTGADGTTRLVECHRLPWALRVEVYQPEGHVVVRQGNSAAKLAQLPCSAPCSPGGTVLDACYELTAVVSHVHNVLDDERAEEGVVAQLLKTAAAAVSGAGKPAGLSTPARAQHGKHEEGHLVAMIKVPKVYWEEAPLQSACTHPPVGAASYALQPSAASHTRINTLRDQGPDSNTSMSGALQLPDSLDDALLVSNSGADSTRTPTLGPTTTTTSADLPSRNGTSSGAAAEPAGSSEQPGCAALTPAAQDVVSSTGSNGGVIESMGSTTQHLAAVGQLEVALGAESSTVSQLLGFEELEVDAGEEEVDQMGWLLLNDFAISALTPEEVLSVYGGQKLPCLLQYSKVEGNGYSSGNQPPETSPAPPPAITPVLTEQEFARLCTAPPLQGSNAGLGPPRFIPLDMSSEAPRPGMLLALDAEFVMVSAPEKKLDANLEVLTRQSRLSLGRVSVLRGEGPRCGTPFIDDYVRTVEPVLDHLTRYSGLVPGDLEPSTSRHYLTTMKHSYLKLRYLIDTGCVFVGHGLKKDFRIINITLPPEQLVDTVELFSRWRQRKMSLRFLASYLLGANIQSAVHDSIEDAASALKLYQVYKTLVDQGTFQAKLDELYSWGNRYGWEPVLLDASGQPIPPAPATLTIPGTTAQ